MTIATRSIASICLVLVLAALISEAKAGFFDNINKIVGANVKAQQEALKAVQQSLGPSPKEIQDRGMEIFGKLVLQSAATIALLKSMPPGQACEALQMTCEKFPASNYEAVAGQALVQRQAEDQQLRSTKASLLSSVCGAFFGAIFGWIGGKLGARQPQA